MFLTAGTKLGPYEIVAPIGAGGMGEVYRAHDTRLKRDVAIKVLPHAAAADPERRERFEREAQAVAALNHPHIVTIHSVEEAGGVFFLTMEVVEGHSLAEALAKGGLQLDRLLKIAIPVADAVAAAHQKGITHRDLKPANIMLGEGEHEGRIKVLDFGLAKLSEVSGAGGAGEAGGPGGAGRENFTQSPTITTPAMTQTGMILGTVAYMSPEQAEGKTIDGRSDIFSIGVILYEMATGQRPFTGDTNASIISSIVKDTPASITALNPALPRDLGRIVRRALAKDPERRYQTAKDLRNDLEELKASIDSGELLVETGSGAMPRHASRLLTWRRGLAVGAGIVTLALGGVAYVSMNHGAQEAGARATAPPASRDFEISQLTTTGNAEQPAISPDGKYVAYIQHDGNDYSVWIRQTATASNVQIVPPEPEVRLVGPTFTADGGFVDFVRTQGSQLRNSELWRVPFLGGAPRRLIDDVESSIAWSPDGQHMAFLRANLARGTTALVVADPDGSHEREIAARQRPAAFDSLAQSAGPNSSFAWSPDGKSIALTGRQGEGSREVVVVDVSSSSQRAVSLPLSTPPQGLAWLNDTTLLLNQPAEDGAPAQLWRVAYPDGSLSRLSNDLSSYAGVSLTADRAALVTMRTERRVGIWVGTGSADDGGEVVAPTPFDLTAYRVGWVGDTLLYTTNTAIDRILPGRGVSEELVAKATNPAVTSDGLRVVFESTETGARYGIWRADADGRHAVQLVRGDGGTTFNMRISPNDRRVLFGSNRSGVHVLWGVSIDGGEPTQVTHEWTGSADVSPDGASLVYVSLDDQGRRFVVTCDLPACTARKSLSIPQSGGGQVRWLPDGNRIAVQDATQANIWTYLLDGGQPRQLTHFADGRRIIDFAWSRDGKRLAVARQATTNDIVLFKGLNR